MRRIKNGTCDRRAAVRAAVAACAVLAAFAPHPVTARRTVVAPRARGDVPDLTTALAVAAPGDTLLLRPGLYQGTYTLAAGVSIMGVAGPDSTILDAAGGRYVFYAKNIDERTTVAGLTIQNGMRPHRNSGGGGFFLYQSSPRILNNVFRGHLGYLGAGVYANHRSNPVIAFNVFRENEAHLGGAIAAYVQCAPLIYNNVMSANKAVSGGAILSLDSSPVILRNTILGNTAADQGGGAIYLDSSPALIAENVVAGSVGSGAIYCIDADAPATIKDNVFWNNDGGPSVGACPGVAGRDGNRDRADDASGGSQSPVEGAGASAWDPARTPEIPPAVVSLWRRQLAQASGR